MIVRDATNQPPTANLGLTQNARGKTVISSHDDAACFQRLASGKTSAIGDQDDQNTLEPNRLEDDEAALAAARLILFKPLELSIKTTQIEGQVVQNIKAESTPDQSQSYLKKTHLNAHVESFCLDQKEVVVGRKSQSHPYTVLSEAYAKLEAETDPRSIQSGMSKPNDIAPNMVASLMPVGLAHAQIPSVQIADLPHVTRVQIDQIKRNAAGVLTTLELVLEPAELGRITARIQSEEGRVTLVLSAEHGSIANDLARDSGLLMRVLGDQIPGIQKMAVFVQTEAQQELLSQGQSFNDFFSSNPDQRQASQARDGFNHVQSAALGDTQQMITNTTGLHIRI